MGRSSHRVSGTSDRFGSLTIVKIHPPHVLSFALAAALLPIPCFEVRAELVQAHLQGGMCAVGDLALLLQRRRNVLVQHD